MKFKNLLLAGFVVSMAAACSSEVKTEMKTGDAMTEEAPKEAEISIVRNWTLENIDASKAMEGMPKENQEQMKTMMDQMVAAQKGKMTFDVQEGGKLATNSLDMNQKWKQMEGKWTLSDDKKTFTIDMDGKKEEYIVEELSADKLNLEMKGEKMNMIFVPKN